MNFGQPVPRTEAEDARTFDALEKRSSRFFVLMNLMIDRSESQPALATALGRSLHSQESSENGQGLIGILGLAKAIGAQPQPFRLIRRGVGQSGGLFISGPGFPIDFE